MRDDRENADRSVVGGVMLIYFLSGACSLIDEVIWVRLLKLVLGNTVYATSIVVSVFMGGLAAGAMLMGRRADRVRRPLRLYAVLEGLVTVSALAVPWMLGAVDGLYGWVYRAWEPTPAALIGVQVAASAVVLLIPSMLMGSTLPLLGSVVTAKGSSIGGRVGWLYSLNVLGAAAGTLLAGFVLIRAVGVMGTLYMAAGLNAVVALSAAALSRRAAVRRQEPRPVARQRRGRRALLAAVFAGGLVGIGYELVWMRSIVHLLGAETYVFSAVLAVYLLGNMIGAGLGSRMARRLKRPELGFAVALTVLGILGVACVPMLVGWSSAARPGLSGWVDRNYVEWPNLVTWGYPLVHCTALFLLPAVVMGMGFPLGLQAWHGHQRGAGRATGKVYGVNTIGAVLGGIVTGFVLIPVAGAQLSIMILGLAAVAAAAGVWLSARPVSKTAWRVLASGGLLAVLIAAATPPDLFRRGLVRYADTALIDVREGVTTTVSVHRHDNGDLWLCSSGLQIAGDRAMSVQRMLGHLPVLLRPDARSVLTVGFGSGETTACLARHGVRRIDCVEISPEVVELSLRHFRHVNLGEHLAERVSLTFMDARNYLHLNRRTYDLIITDSINPKYFAENASLYTREYFHSAAEHLNPGGLVVCWIPFTLPKRCFDSILGTFLEVFPSTTLWFPATKPDHFVLAVGSRRRQTFPLARMREELARERVRRSLRSIGIHTVEDVFSCYLGDEEDIQGYLRAYTANTDDRPFVEFSTDPAQTGGAEWRFVARLIAGVRRRSVHAHVDPTGLPRPQRRRLAPKLDRLHGIGAHLLRTQLVVRVMREDVRSDELIEAVDRTLAPEGRSLLTLLSAYLKDGGGYLTGHSVRGSLYLAAGDYRGARADFDRVIRLDPENGIAFKSRATARYLLGDYAGAWADAERCRQLGLPLDPQFIAGLRRRPGD